LEWVFGTHFLFVCFSLVLNKAEILAEIEKTLATEMPEIDVVDVETAGGQGNRVLRVFIDHPDGVDHQRCAQVTGCLNRFLEDYTVEVSSPGIERRLRRPEHFRAAVGQKINLHTYGPVKGQRNFTGFLLSAEGGELRLDVDGGEVVIRLDDIAHAQTVFEFGS
jgi:ribosome maturation factor RimP